MKKSILICLLGAVLFSFTGCSEDSPIEIIESAQETISVKEETASMAEADTTAEAEKKEEEKPGEPEAEDEKNSDISAYAPVLDETCDLIYNGFSEDDRFEFVAPGVMDMANWMEKDELLKTVGYHIEDLNGDGTAELMIGTIPDKSSEVQTEGDIYGGYTLADDKPVSFLEGWSRNMYQWLGGGRFYYYGSGGAAYSAFGTYHLEPGKSTLTCEDFYFTDTKDGSLDEIVPYHNTTGKWDASASEELNLTQDEFWKIDSEFTSGIQTMDMTPLADYRYKGGK